MYIYIYIHIMDKTSNYTSYSWYTLRTLLRCSLFKIFSTFAFTIDLKYIFYLFKYIKFVLNIFLFLKTNNYFTNNCLFNILTITLMFVHSLTDMIFLLLRKLVKYLNLFFLYIYTHPYTIII